MAPVWFVVDDDETIVFNTGERTVKERNLRRDPRAAFCSTTSAPFLIVVVQGRVNLSDDLAEVLRWATRIGGRYMGEGQAEAYGRRNPVPGVATLTALAPWRHQP